MVRVVFAANAAMSIAALALCAWHAGRDRERQAFLATSVVYGVLLEQLVIVAFESYRYSLEDFLLTLGDVPLVIGFGWAAIIYSGFHLGERLGVSRRVRPLFVALYALHVDVAIDAVAVRVPFWTWTPPGPWFGVPLGNFLGWFLVAGLYAGAWQVLRPRVRSTAVRCALTVVLAVGALVPLLHAWTSVVTTLPRQVAVLGALVALALAAVLRDGLDPGTADPRIAAVPLLYHGFYLAVYLGLGMYADAPLLLPVSLAMIAVGLALHRPGGVRTHPQDSATPR